MSWWYSAAFGRQLSTVGICGRIVVYVSMQPAHMLKKLLIEIHAAGKRDAFPMIEPVRFDAN